MLNQAFQSFIPGGIYAFMLVFARIGALVMLIPGIGESYVSTRIRLALALLVAGLIAPNVATLLPALPGEPFTILVQLVAETGVGLFIGGMARMMLSSLQIAGSLIATQSGLAAAQFFDPSQGSQTAAIAALLNFFGIILIFATDTHLLLFRSALDSYTMFPPGTLPLLGDFANQASQQLGASFRVGVQMSAPFVVYGLVFNVGLGLLQRLMPSLQVFFIAQPAQIALAFMLLAVSIGGAGMWFLDHFEASIAVLNRT